MTKSLRFACSRTRDGGRGAREREGERRRETETERERATERAKEKERQCKSATAQDGNKERGKEREVVRETEVSVWKAEVVQRDFLPGFNCHLENVVSQAPL